MADFDWMQNRVEGFVFASFVSLLTIAQVPTPCMRGRSGHPSDQSKSNDNEQGVARAPGTQNPGFKNKFYPDQLEIVEIYDVTSSVFFGRNTLCHF